MSTISATTSNPGSINAMNTVSGTAKSLDQNDFLKLLVAQIQFQDPMNPKSNSDMAAQMAQFTSLQQSTESSSSLAMIKASGLIGSQVLLQVDDQNQTAGIVSGLQMKNGKPQIMVNNVAYDLGQVLSVAPAPAPVATTPGVPVRP